jgi:hypothetical protein
MIYAACTVKRGKNFKLRLPEKPLRVIPIVPAGAMGKREQRLALNSRFFRLPFRSYYLSPVWCEEGYVNLGYFC